MENFLDEIELEEDAQKNRYLKFYVDDLMYGIEIKKVIEIIGIQSITPMPNVTSDVKGVISLRGKIIPVLDVRLRFGKEAIPYNDRTCIIIINVNDTTTGLIVDKVSDVSQVAEENIEDIPDIVAETNDYITEIAKVNEEVMMILDCEKLVNN